MTLSLLLVSLTTACVADAADPTSTEVSASDIHVNPATDLVEPGFVNGTLCQLVFPGALTSSTEFYEIWAVGTNGIVNTTFNTSRPNLYAIFGTSTPLSEVHHVDGFSQFDHYHVIPNNDGTEVENRVWDLFLLFPGPNYDAATYQPAKSLRAMQAQSNAGVLTQPMTPSAAGFPDVVLNIPIKCPKN
jgi:hypothetical protein